LSKFGVQRKVKLSRSKLCRDWKVALEDEGSYQLEKHVYVADRLGPMRFVPSAQISHKSENGIINQMTYPGVLRVASGQATRKWPSTPQLKQTGGGFVFLRWTGGWIGCWIGCWTDCWTGCWFDCW